MNYLARQTLFHFPPLGWLISTLDAIPIDRDGLGLTGIKESLRRLKRGEMVLIFPEGRRSSDGEIATFRPGFTVLAARLQCVNPSRGHRGRLPRLAAIEKTSPRGEQSTCTTGKP